MGQWAVWDGPWALCCCVAAAPLSLCLCPVLLAPVPPVALRLPFLLWLPPLLLLLPLLLPCAAVAVCCALLLVAQRRRLRHTSTGQHPRAIGGPNGRWRMVPLRRLRALVV